MANIPEYQRQRLESSAVGTPGVDDSGQRIGQAISGAAEAGSKVFMNLELQRREAKDAAYAHKTLVEQDLDFDNIAYENRKKNAEFRGDPTEPVNMLKGSLESRVRDTVDAMPAGAARNAVEQNIWGIVGRKLSQERSFFERHQTVLAFNDSISATNTLAKQAGIAAKETGLSLDEKKLFLESYMKQGEKTYKVFAPILAPEEREKLKVAIPENIAKGFLTDSIDANPAEAIEALDKGWFDKVLDVNDKSKLRKAAVESLGNQKEIADMNLLSADISQNQDRYQKYLAGDLSFAEIEQIPNPQLRAKWQALRLKSKPYSAADKFATYMDRNDEYIDAVKGKGEKIKARVPLDKLLALQVKIIDDVNEGRIDADSAGSLMKKLSVPTVKKMKAAGNFFSDLDKTSRPFQAAYNFVKQEAKKSSIPSSVQANTLIAFERQLPSLGEDPSPESVNKLIRQSYVQAVHKSYPGLVLPDQNTTRLMTANGQDIRLKPSNDKGAKKVSKDYVLGIDKTTNKKWRRYPDGRYEPHVEAE